jgi:hypothetical protein
MSIKFQVRRSNNSTWSSANPTLASGELGFETDTNKLKIGNGSNTWNTLSYIAGGVINFDSVAAVNSSTIDSAVNYIQTSSYYSSPIGGGGLYKRYSDTPAGSGFGTAYITSNGGNVYWELSEDSPNVKQFGAKDNVAFDSTSAIQGAIEYIEAKEGGVLKLGHGIYRVTSTIDLDSTFGVQLIGEGADIPHDIFKAPGTTGAAGAATELYWAGANEGTVIQFRTANNLYQKQSGCALTDVKINCTNSAKFGLVVESISAGIFRRLNIIDARTSNTATWQTRGAAVKITTLPTANTGSRDAMDTQRCVFDRVICRLGDEAEGAGSYAFWITSFSPFPHGHPASRYTSEHTGSNSSLNYFIMCDTRNIATANTGGVGWFIEDADNNTFINCRAFQLGGTAGAGTNRPALLIPGTNESTGSNQFWNFSAPVAAGDVSVRILGITSNTFPHIGSGGTAGGAAGYVVDPKNNTFWATDTSNGTQYPTLDSNCLVGRHTDYNAWRSLIVNKLSLGDGDADARNGFALLEGASPPSLRIQNNSENHIVIENANSSVRWGISTSGQNLRILKSNGSGGLLISANVGFYGTAPIPQPTAIANVAATSDVANTVNSVLVRLRSLGLIST